MKSLISADFVTNSWCIDTGAFAPDGSELDDFVAIFKDFYDDIESLLSVDIAQTGHIIKFIDLESVLVPNYPYFETTFNLLTNPSAAAFPQEVALCLSMQGARVSGTPQARRRGRVFIGPITTATMTDGRPNSTARGTLATAADTLAGNLKAAERPSELSIWSVTDGVAVVVRDGWVDNAYDTQRRRGVSPTARSVFEVA